jgi:hypothetical protein
MVKRRLLLRALVAGGMVAMAPHERTDETRVLLAQIRDDLKKSSPATISSGGSLEGAIEVRRGMQCPQIT